MERASLLLSALRALCGVITPNVRKVSVDEKANVITLYFYYASEPTENEVELSEDAATEVIADFPSPYLINCERRVIEAPKKIQVEGNLVYSRFE